jgi:Tfp pilus assembly protein PilV
MNKKSFSLIEVLIAVSLLSVVLVIILQVKEKNLNFIESYNASKKYNEYISIAASYDSNNTSLNNNIYLSDILNTKNDAIRKELKAIKVQIKNEIHNTIDLNTDDLDLSVQINKTSLNIEKKISKNFYTFKLQY